jgi:N-acyl-D-aspartate/D-glutamate deacylase
MSEFDVIVVGDDGTGTQRYRADVGIRGRIAKMGRPVVGRGHVLTQPDDRRARLHRAAHYDAQLFWDPYLSPPAGTGSRRS